ncbi:MAG: UDPGP type 1 family protein [Clostridia bacterium]|nr:UDPGP type 1 family protein [Clostridia bacterium]
MDRLNEIKMKLVSFGQEHLLSFLDELTQKEQEALLNQIKNIDFELVSKLYNERNVISNTGDIIQPLGYVDKFKLSNKEAEEYAKLGEEAIQNGELAFVTLAGGQGTRLGHNGPKGTYMLGIVPDKSLFEILCDSLKRVKSEHNVYIPWYIMTSRENNDDTIDFFESNNYFGYPKELVKFFKQEELPMVQIDGRIILETKSKVKEAADGHGGIFEAMHKNGIVQDMEDKGIKWVFIGGIDNILLKMVDPVFMGLAISRGVKIAGKSIVKANPEEKVGVFCKRNGKPSVIEYTEITEEMAYESDTQGELLYGESHILCNMFNIQALKQIENEKLPYHTAFKKSSFIDVTGKEITPLMPNAYKFETFIFDAFNKFDDMLIFRVLREEEFAPIKNKEGVDSPETARRLYRDYWNV